MVKGSVAYAAQRDDEKRALALLCGFHAFEALEVGERVAVAVAGDPVDRRYRLGCRAAAADDVIFVLQEPQLGTGHAVQVTRRFLTEMLKAAGFGKSRDAMGGGVGEDQFSSFLRDAQATEMVRAGGIGLAESLFEALKEKTDVQL